MVMSASEKIVSFIKPFPRVVFRKGEFLLSPYVKPAGIFFLTSGIVRMCNSSKKGDEVIINVYKPISFFPLGWLLNDTENTFFFEAVSLVRTSVVPKPTVRDFLEHEPGVTYDLLQRIVRGLDGYFLRVEGLMSGDARMRVVIQLVLQARRFGKKTREGDVLEMTHQTLASLSGLSRETVTREIGKLQKQGKILYRNKTLVIPNIELLEHEIFL